jgi:hypothetical protein
MKNFHFFIISLALFSITSSFQLKAQVPGNGLVFDGDDDYVNVTTTTSDELNPLETLTLECWVYLNEVPSSSHTPHLISRFNCYALAVESNERARGYIRTDEGEWFYQDGTTTIVPNKWYHLAATYDGSNLRIFVNGEEEGAKPVSDTMARTTDNFRIGARNAYVTNTNTNGIIDEARVWDVTRTQAEIRSSMNRTIPGSTPGLVGYWRFDDGSGTNADCETSYDNDGTLMHMSVPAVWVMSTASMGDASIFAESADITETSECAVDVVFGSSPRGPGAGHSMAVMQVDQLPNRVSGLYPDRAQLYWEIWSENPDFDGNYTADVRFHYDDINNLPNESSLELFRRDDANGTWTAVTGITVVTNDGGSSTVSDGTGYVEFTITDGTTGGFSGQYILSWSNEPPVVSNIPDQSVAEGSAFATINLDDYVADPDNADDEITWTFSGDVDVTVTITDRVATLTADDPDWNGTDMVTFTAEDPDGETDSDQATFTVTTVNDPPVVDAIPNQSIAEDSSFAQINLDDYVVDADNADNEITWTVTAESDVIVTITNRVASITANDPEWNGTDVVTFTATDPGGLQDWDNVVFSVNFVNDLPVVADIPDQTIVEGQSFSQINLDDFVDDADHIDDSINWTAIGQSDITVSIVDRVATFTIDPDWNGTDTIVFMAEDSSGGQDSDTATFTVTPVNDSPVVADIPDQEVAEGLSFATINLDDYVADVDDADSAITWTATGQSDLTVDITDRVATIMATDPEWNGSDTLIFTVTDLLGASDTSTCIFTVLPVDDPPTLKKAIPDTSAEAEKAFLMVLDPNTFDDIDAGDNLVYSAVITWGGGTPGWITFDPSSRKFSGTPAHADKGMLEVIVTAMDDSLASAADTFSIEVLSYVGIVNPLAALEIKLFPNPNDGRFIFESEMFELKDVVLEIFNEKGQLIWNRKIKNEIGTLRESVDLSNSPEGLYLLRVRNESGVLNKQFVISH